VQSVARRGCLGQQSIEFVFVRTDWIVDYIYMHKRTSSRDKLIFAALDSKKLLALIKAQAICFSKEYKYFASRGRRQNPI
jgi:hypothetical protein